MHGEIKLDWNRNSNILKWDERFQIRLEELIFKLPYLNYNFCCSKKSISSYLKGNINKRNASVTYMITLSEAGIW